MLRAHREGPQRLSNLQENINWAAEATIRGAISALCEFGALEKRRVDQTRNAVSTQLTPAGREMLVVPKALEAWLARCPKGPIALEDEHVKVAVKALAEGWSSTLMRALATAPSTLTELSQLIHEVSYPALERRIGWMRASGQIEALPKEPRGTPYVPTDWLRRAIAPLCVAGRCERSQAESAPPITDVEIEAAFLLTLPLVRLSAPESGTCLLAAQTDGDADNAHGAVLAGTAVEVRDGAVVACSLEWESEPETWAIGNSDLWLDAVIDGGSENLRIGGAEPRLARDLVDGLHAALFPEGETASVPLLLLCTDLDRRAANP